jgi:four helix bundle protein
MGTFKSFEEIEAWKRSRELSRRIYELTIRGTFAKDFELRNQINRAVGSIMDNIAEGFDRGGNREFIQALSIAKGSAGETRSQLYRALDRKHITAEEFDELSKETIQITRMVGSLISYLGKSLMKGPKFRGRVSHTVRQPE